MRERGVKITSGIQVGYALGKQSTGTHRLGERREPKGKKGRYQEMEKMEEKMVPEMNILVIFSRAHSTGMVKNGGGESTFHGYVYQMGSVSAYKSSEGEFPFLAIV